MGTVGRTLGLAVGLLLRFVSVHSGAPNREEGHPRSSTGRLLASGKCREYCCYDDVGTFPFHCVLLHHSGILPMAPPFIVVEIQLGGPVGSRPTAPQGVPSRPRIRGGRQALHKGGLQTRLTRGLD